MIVAVLWILASLTALVVIYALFVTSTSATVATSSDRIQTEAIISAAIELACHRLLSVDEKERPADDQFETRIGPTTTTVSYFSEAARIDLNVAPKEFLAGLMVGLGESPERAASSADRIVAWRKPIQSGAADSDTEDSDYRVGGSPYLPRHAAFPHIEELWLVRGIAPLLVERMMPYVTVLNGAAAIDLRVAAPQVIAALPHMDPEKLQRILDQRRSRQNDPRALLALAAPDQELARTESSRTLRISIDIAFDNRRRASSDVVILLLDGGPEPYRLLARRDNVDGVAPGGSRQAGMR